MRVPEDFVGRFFDWLQRVSTIERFLVKASLGVLVTVFAGPPLVILLLRTASGTVPSDYQHIFDRVELIDHWILLICLILILVALVIGVIRFSGEIRANERRRTLVIEARGLRDDDGNALVDQIKCCERGQKIPIFIELRNGLDGNVIEPERAVEEISAAHRSYLQNIRSIDRSDLDVVYGGLTPVPYTFLTGVLLDDERSICLYDWDREQESWRIVDGRDDGQSFEVSGLGEVSATDVVLAISFSYFINESDLATTFTHDVVRMTMGSIASDGHWSIGKQTRLAHQFLEVSKKLSAQGARRIHLIMAAPNSLVFSFGRRYDKRNLPEIIVYQYQRGQSPAYPWGIIMPVCSIEKPGISWTECLGKVRL